MSSLSSLLLCVVADGTFSCYSNSELIRCKNRLPDAWRGGGNIFSTFDVISEARQSQHMTGVTK